MGWHTDTSMTTHDSSPQRTATRAPVGKPIRLQFDGTPDIAEGTCRNISIGGMFIEADLECAHGSLVRFELVLDEATSIRGLAEVVWARSKSFGPGHESGLGIKFRFLEQQDRQLIFKLVSQYIKERLASRPPMTLDPSPAAPSGEIFEPPDPPVQAAPAHSSPSDVPVVSSESPSAEPYGLEDDGGGQQAPSRGEADDGGAWPGEERQESSHDDPRDSPSPWRQETDEPARSAAHATASHSATYFDDAPIDLNAREHEPAWQPDAELTGAVDAPTFSANEGAGLPSGLPQRVSRRPKRRSSLLPLLVLGVILALLVFFFRDGLFGPPAPMDEPLPTRVGGSAEPTGVGLPSTPREGSDGTAPRTRPQVGVEVPLDNLDGGTPDAAAVDAEPPEDEPSTPPVKTLPPSPPSADTSARSTGREMQRIEDIQWRQVGQGLEITVTADGDIPRRRVKTFRLDGDSPREVIQLLGIGVGYSGRTIAVDGPGVRQIRTGLHERRGVNELRMVLDLTGSSVRVTDLTTEGRQLRIRIEVD